MTWMHERAHASRTRRRASGSAPVFDPADATDPSAAGPYSGEGGRLGIPHILGRRARWMTARLRQGARA
ncbi:hypothetical protein ACIQGZ_02875 [Streptomyces sp. NPDC092296]|uniref:hypothetical protein n=1 Tax=Streptomyces sp. NPDC092296 TaxID=3366012 RepID=UPI0038266064